MQEVEYYLNKDILSVIFDYLWPDFIRYCGRKSLLCKRASPKFIMKLASVAKSWALAAKGIHGRAKAYLAAPQRYYSLDGRDIIIVNNSKGIIHTVLNNAYKLLRHTTFLLKDYHLTIYFIDELFGGKVFNSNKKITYRINSEQLLKDAATIYPVLQLLEINIYMRNLLTYDFGGCLPMCDIEKKFLDL